MAISVSPPECIELTLLRSLLPQPPAQSQSRDEHDASDDSDEDDTSPHPAPSGGGGGGGAYASPATTYAGSPASTTPSDKPKKKTSLLGALFKSKSKK